MSKIDAAGIFALGRHTVNRLGYGAMQLAGSGVFGPPTDRAAAVPILREAVESGVNHIDTSAAHEAVESGRTIGKIIPQRF